MTDFNITPLGGFGAQLGQQLAGLGQQVEDRRVVEERQLQQEEAIARRRQLSNLALGGDTQAISDLYAEFPQLGQQIQQEMFRRAQASTAEQQQQTTAQTQQFLRRYFATPQEGRQALLEEVSQDPAFSLVSADDELLGMAPEVQEGNARVLARSVFEQDVFDELTRDPATFERGTFQFQETPTGVIRLNTATGQAEQLEIGSRAEEQAREETRKALEQELEQEGETFQRAEKLRNRYDKLSGDFFKVRDAFNRIEATEDTAAGDLALIFNYMKMLDPGSVVREGEFATAQNTTGIDDRVLNTYNRLLTGERLNPAQRIEFTKQAGSLFEAAQDQNANLRDETLRLGDRYGVNESDLFGAPSQIIDFGALPSG